MSVRLSRAMDHQKFSVVDYTFHSPWVQIVLRHPLLLTMKIKIDPINIHIAMTHLLIIQLNCNFVVIDLMSPFYKSTLHFDENERKQHIKLL